MRPRHHLDLVGDELTAGERETHALMVQGQPITDADAAELEGHAAGGPDSLLDGVGDAAQVHVAGNDLIERVGHADEGQLHLPVAEAERPQERPVRRPGYALFDVVTW